MNHLQMVDPDARVAGLLASLDLGSLIPSVYAQYAPAFRDVLAAFLAKLPSDRLERIIEAQAALPTTARPAERVVSLIHSCPTLHKLGQVVARHRALEPTFRQQLQQLETMVPRAAMPAVKRVLREELGNKLQSVRLGDKPLAEASVAVVVPFRWADPSDARRADGVFKVLKPGVEEALSQELAVWGEVGDLLDHAIDRYGLPPVDYRATLEQVRDLLSREVRLEREQAHLVDASKAYAGHDDVVVPKLLPLSTPRVTAMTRIEGCKVTDAHSSATHDRSELAATIVHALIAHPFLSRGPRALFHADPHAGNLIATGDGRLGILDWSLTGRLCDQARVQIAQILLGGMTLDAARVCRAIAALAANHPDEDTLRSVVANALTDVRRGSLPGLNWLVRLLDAAVTAGGARFDSELLLFRKSLFTLEGVVADVSTEVAADTVLLRIAMGQMAAEWPARLWSPSTSRAFPTHLSNLDLASLAMSLPAGCWRFWTGLSLDWFINFTGHPSIRCAARA